MYVSRVWMGEEARTSDGDTRAVCDGEGLPHESAVANVRKPVLLPFEDAGVLEALGVPVFKQRETQLITCLSGDFVSLRTCETFRLHLVDVLQEALGLDDCMACKNQLTTRISGYRGILQDLL